MAKIRQAQEEKERKVTFELFTADIKYDPETGTFWRRADVDDGSRGYRKISITIEQKRHWVKAHRAAHLVMTGEWPKHSVDHRDLDKQNNRWDNLREATHAQNMANVRKRSNTSAPYKGVSKRKDACFVAYLTHNSKRSHLGCFRTAEEANWVAADAAFHAKKSFHRIS